MATEEKNTKVKAIIVLEMIGRPVEHLKEVMDKIVETIDKETGIKVKNKTHYEPKKLDNKDHEGKIIEMPQDQWLYTTFSEVELEAESIFDLIRVCFNYMPSNVEIIEPTSFNLANRDMNSLMGALLSKLHNYDSIAKSALLENQALVRELGKYSKPKLEIVENPEVVNKESEEKPKKKKAKK